MADAPSPSPAAAPRSLRPVAQAARRDLFQKCVDYTAAEEVRAAGLYPYFRAISTAQDTEVEIDGKPYIMLGSNSYLGLATHPEVVEAARAATAKYGTGCGGSRFLNGTLDIHIELEDRLANLVGKDRALCFTTGYQVNVGVISALVGKGDYLIGDKLNHASIVDGALMAFGRTVRYNHNDVAHLRKVLDGLDPHTAGLLVTDSVFSMEGEIAPLADIVAAAEEYGVRTMIDEAHAIGVFGATGAGLVADRGLTDHVDLLMGTFSKSLASIGGFIAGDAKVIDYLQHNARALMFSASMTPAAAGAALTALDIMEREPGRREQLWANTRRMRDGLIAAGFNLGNSATPVIPIIVGEMTQCFTFWKAVTEAGLFVNPVAPPAVEDGNCLIRVSLMATHTDAQIDRALDILSSVAHTTGVL